jgi:hypothetical protein
MWVQYIKDNSIVVLTTGFVGSLTFKGTAMPCEEYPNGEYRDNWSKGVFQPLVGEIQFTISNED